MTTLYWNGSAFAPMNKTAAKKEAALLRLEAAFMGADAIPSHKQRGLCISAKTDSQQPAELPSALYGAGGSSSGNAFLSIRSI